MNKRRVRKRDQCRQASSNDLVMSHVWLVRGIARSVQSKLPRHLELDDLIEDGVLGLIAASRRYEPGIGVPFPLYAKHRIRGAIVDGLRRMDHLSRDSRAEAKKIEREHELPSPDRRGCAAGRDACGGRIALTDNGAPEPVAGTGWQPDVVAGHEELSATLREAISTLPARYGEIVALYHWRGLTMREIGRSYGINES
ncbi:MAG: sigma-70 family RNA polymerase sigma factor, partial [Bryobacterales bacterium]|nr:sigma-70 family RNA polymerase sigma factor [Bryobacterales bacterium]